MMKHLTSFSFLIFIFGLILSPTLEVNAERPDLKPEAFNKRNPLIRTASIVRA